MTESKNACACSCGAKTNPGNNAFHYGTLMLAGLVMWAVAYSQLEAFADWAVGFLALTDGHAKEAAHFFIYDTPKVLLLLGLVVFLMGVVRSFFSPERTRALLSGKREGLAHVLAACFGILTPFCTCSAVSLFIGFVSAGIPLGVTFSFLISAPMVNEIALGLLFGLVGWKVAAIYLCFGLTLAIVAGWVIGRFHLEGWLQDWVREVRAGEAAQLSNNLTFADRIRVGFDSARDIMSKVGLWVVLGIAVGAFIHGYAPADTLAQIMGKGSWWSVPAAVIIGIPLYSNAAGIIPIVEALLGKGAALGTVLAFMMSVTALSLPEAIILRKVLTFRLLAVFFGIVSAGILAVGFLFNAILN